MHNTDRGTSSVGVLFYIEILNAPLEKGACEKPKRGL